MCIKSSSLIDTAFTDVDNISNPALTFHFQTPPPQKKTTIFLLFVMSE